MWAPSTYPSKPARERDSWKVGIAAAAAAPKSLQSRPTLCDPRDGSPPGSPVPGILQARALEWVGICFSNAWKWKVKVKLVSCVWLPATPWTVAYQAPPSHGIRQARILEWVAIVFSKVGTAVLHNTNQSHHYIYLVIFAILCWWEASHGSHHIQG